jgi:EmrB/QacA subfamily drug resistance transporter
MRGLQGVGAAMLVPGSLALISSSFDGAERGKAIGTWSGWTAITAAIGPVMGGWLVQHASWRWVFFLNVPLAVVVVAVTLWRVPESRNQELHGGPDWLGAALVTAGLGGMTYALIEWQGGRGVWPAAAVGVVGLLGFIAVEDRSRSPMVSLQLFRSRDFSGANLLTLFLYGGLGGVFYFLPLNLIQVQGYSPTEAGAALLPLIGLMFALSRWSGGLIGRFGARLPLTVGPLISAVGFGLFARPEIGGSYWTTVFPAVVVLGLGMAVSVAPLTTAVMNSVSRSEAGVASGVNNAVSRAAQLMSVAMLGLVLTAVFNARLERGLDRAGISGELRAQVESQRGRLAGAQVGDAAARRAVDEAFVAGYRVVLWIAAGMSALSAASALVLMEDRRGSPVAARA